MKVLLIKDVKGLGKAGEIKEVKDGYGNNFLIGKGFAKSATTDVLRQFEAAKQRQAEDQRYEVESLNSLKTELEKVRVKIAKQVGANGALFGSITKDEIAAALKEQKNLEVDKKALDLGHVKTTGIYDVNVKFKHGISAKFEIEVVAE
ncbi:50S ribosomal protein L9 [Campylobacter geochelonis]|uniref:Large ribosomal subunit protein bL9 n=1 Tax=Campylobacter geochelonis TaxID=1780362 RepID=A0A128ESQ5_9BACT|nr:50S ribosomal protein L9 [Campylobacter geochelonis]QKF71238.1 50S ribosomal protein L9 [Campylobacter geochelonis]CZE49173.1 ribosomal protein L9 [Campylobacter geochelonis]CZE49452.1 ribosomal protein L9 [Campylobacter geochelonis]CZE51505.1 ribosomal protein L9 [Campylobacter geochelonis]